MAGCFPIKLTEDLFLVHILTPVAFHEVKDPKLLLKPGVSVARCRVVNKSCAFGAVQA